jgi:predicted ATPase/serine phosphatase RsbU (regulator of sigma subunit)
MHMIPGYQIQGLLHDSPRTLVYQAISQQTQQPVILKIPRAERPPLQELARLRHEFSLLSDLASTPGVIRVHDLVAFDRSLALVVEDIGAQSLRSMLEAAPLPLPVFLAMAQALSRSLDALHAQGIVHKDINPNNVLLPADHPGACRIIDFGLSSRLSRETSLVQQHYGGWVGTLAYISPEQTGRMNRPVDYRTDLYSLGATLYHALTGSPPFDTQDPMALVHAHMARAPLPPSRVKPDLQIPSALDAVLLTLLAKAPEDRYQSAAGLAADLSLIARDLSSPELLTFTPRQRDAWDHFSIPDKLYGRDAEVAALLAAFDRVERAEELAAFVLVDGEAGCGKTALIQAVLQPLTRARGHLIRGKCDPLQRDTPYAALVQGLHDLTHALLSADEQTVARWRARLIAALGPNGQLITRIIPALALIIGPQPEVADLPPAESQNRFHSVFRSFLKAFAAPEHPLVIALDDLQWADTATLKLIEALLCGADDTSHLLFITSARPEGLDPAHPLTSTLGALDRAGVEVTRLHLNPLRLADVSVLLSDTLRRDDAAVGALAALLLDRTQGNAFFLSQLLLALHQDGALRFDTTARRWEWDLDILKRAGFRQDVSSLLAAKVQRLPALTQRALIAAACIGTTFSPRALASALEQPLSATLDALHEAIRAGLIEPRGDAFLLFASSGSAELEDDGAEAHGVVSFFHDHIRQAALSGADPQTLATFHLRLGRARLASVTTAEEATSDAALFSVLGHFEQAQALLTDPTERLRLARLALRAGQKAIASIAYDAAATHLAFGADMLGDAQARWAADPALTFSLLIELARSRYLTGAFSDANALFIDLLAHASDPIARAHVVTIKMTLDLNTGRLAEVIEQGLISLALLDHLIDPSPAPEAIGAHLTAVLGLIPNGADSIDALIDLPPMTDPRHLSAMAIMFFGAIASYLSGRTSLWQVFVLRMVHTSITHGSSPFGAYAYPAMGMIAGPGLGDYKAGHAWGRLGVEIAERSANPSFRCVANFLMGCFIDYWGRPLRDGIPILEQAFQDGLDSGNLIYCAYCLSGIAIAAVADGQPLSVLAERVPVALAFSQKIQYDDIAQYYPIYQQFMRALEGRTASPTSLSDADFDEEAFLAQLLPRSFPVPQHVFHILKLQLAVLFGDLSAARASAAASEALLPVSFSLHHATEHHLYRALLDALDPCPADAAAARARLDAARALFAQWAEAAPANFLAKQRLLDAEAARLDGDELEAMRLYSAAIDLARTHRYLHIEAITCERLGLLHLHSQRLREANLYLRDAMHAFSRWGAPAKAQQLTLLHGVRLDNQSPPAPLSALSSQHTQYSSDYGVFISGSSIDVSMTQSAGAHLLDLSAVLKASRALSGEIVLSNLLGRLIQICVEAAGAQRGVFVARYNNELVIEAEYHIDREILDVLPNTALAARADLPQTLLRYVARTNERVVLGDASSSSSSFHNDAAVISRKLRSVLCLAVTTQGKQAGVLYLENNLAADTFTVQRCELLEALSAQAAISLENARLYDTLEQRVRDRTLALQESLRLVTESQQRLADELSEAAAYIRSLLPPPMRDPSLQTDWRFLPSASLGGDAFSYRWLVPDEQLAVYLLDVCGHGMASALLSISVLNALHSHSLPNVDFSDPGAVLSGLNDAFPSRRHNGLFFTIWYGVYDMSSRTLRYASAGHPPAVLIGGGGAPNTQPSVIELATPGPMIGIAPNVGYKTARHTLSSAHPAHHLFIFSDGAYELANTQGQVIDYDDFLKALTDASATPQCLEQMVLYAKRIRDNQPLEDDFSMLQVTLR